MESSKTHFEVLGLEAYMYSKKHFTFKNGRNLGENLRRPFLFFFRRTPDFSPKIGASLHKHSFFWRSPGKFFADPFFWRTLAPCVLGLEIEGLSSRSRSLASNFFVSLASKVVPSTPPLIIMFKHRLILVRRFLDVLPNCWQPTAVT